MADQSKFEGKPLFIDDADDDLEDIMHVYGRDEQHLHPCVTDARGKSRSPFDLVLHAPGGAIALWAENVTLCYRFEPRSLRRLSSPEGVSNKVRELLAAALIAWGDAAPVRFKEVDHGWDFEIVVRNANDCTIHGCVLASAFFPDAGQHELIIYPEMFDQSEQEQVETLIHELGHVFGLRHFFAQESESIWPSVIFGEHSKVSIMNYGEDSRLTGADLADLKNLYKRVWSGALKNINGTPIILVKPFSALQPLSVAAAQP